MHQNCYSSYGALRMDVEQPIVGTSDPTDDVIVNPIAFTRGSSY